MKSRAIAIGALGLAASAMIAPTEVRAITLAGNLTPATIGTANSLIEFANTIGAENFVLSQSATVNALGLTVWHPRTSIATLTSIDWYIYADSDTTSGVFGLPSSALFSGNTSSFSLTNLGVVSANTTFDYIQVDFSIPDALLSAGDYWVGFSTNATLPNYWGYWASAAPGDGLNARYSPSAWVQPYSTGTGLTNTMFEVSGNLSAVGAVPLPAALPLFATALGGMGLLGWRRRRKAAE